ncbi:5-oxoprolinase/urea amidolyase family protein [Microbacterium rhizomatis]|uniref:5-oxoprolinase/urea amidolyase family protein n=1 Tax=Microbacterium rhizomatis TaxID=1631477 RepID=A0A5J5J1N7_9MICO|nr:5-oxoprolinase/urea amidolyase family protein [Microbacterium rhizomatis]
MRVLPMGDRAVLVEVDGLGEVLALHKRLAASRPAGVVDLVPAARTVLVRVDGAALSVTAARAWIEGAAADWSTPRDAAPTPDGTLELGVRYDGPDLADTAALLGLTPGQLIAQHAAAEWTVAFTGFAPGFGYLVSPGWTHEVPRLDTPRTRVPRGAVGLAAGFTGAYPRETPGGWRLIATTDARLFDPDAVAPASPVLLAPGTRVRFRPMPSGSRETATGRREGAHPGPGGAGAIRIVEPGLLSTIQDLGRPGRAALGIAPSGALDRRALRAANRLVGNAEGAAGVEVTMGGFRAIAERDAWFAVTGAWGPVLLDGLPVDPYEARAWPRGAELRIDGFVHGARAYLALRGGADAALSAGSRSTDLLAGLGPAALRAGDLLAIGGGAVVPIPVAEVWPWEPPHDGELEIELARGAREDWFTASAHDLLFAHRWTVSAHADRVGLRLDGPELARVTARELPSEGMVPGALQVPPSGRPTILLADGPVTGGYPVIAVVTDAALDDLAQLRPGSRIRFRHARR